MPRAVSVLRWVVQDPTCHLQQWHPPSRARLTEVQSLSRCGSCRTMRCGSSSRPRCGGRAARCRPGCGSAWSARTGRLPYKVRRTVHDDCTRHQRLFLLSASRVLPAVDLWPTEFERPGTLVLRRSVIDCYRAPQRSLCKSPFRLRSRQNSTSGSSSAAGASRASPSTRQTPQPRTYWPARPSWAVAARHYARHTMCRSGRVSRRALHSSAACRPCRWSTRSSGPPRMRCRTN